MKRTSQEEYRIWCGIKTRCYNPNATGFKNCGGRGIKVCERWMDYNNFLADMGPRPSHEHSIERVNNDGDYEPGNCIWIPLRDQAKNQRPKTHKRAVEQAMCASAGVNYDAWRWRVKQGMDPLDALDKPFIKKKWTRWLDQPATIAGRTMTMRDWANERGIHRDTLHHRIKIGMPLEEALSRPLQQGWKGRFIAGH